MKRLLLFAGLLLGAGCFTAAPPPDIIAPAAAPAARSFPPVTPDPINETNARQWAQSLMEELDREAQQNALAGSPR